MKTVRNGTNKITREKGDKTMGHDDEMLDICKKDHERFEKHLDESEARVILLHKHDGIINEYKEDKNWIKRTFVLVALTIVLQIGSFLYMWGRVTAIVDNNVSRIEEFESLFTKTVKTNELMRKNEP